MGFYYSNYKQRAKSNMNECGQVRLNIRYPYNGAILTSIIFYLIEVKNPLHSVSFENNFNVNFHIF